MPLPRGVTFYQTNFKKKTQLLLEDVFVIINCDIVEKKMATHSGILAWRISMDRGVWQATDHGVSKSRTQLSD